MGTIVVEVYSCDVFSQDSLRIYDVFWFYVSIFLLAFGMSRMDVNYTVTRFEKQNVSLRSVFGFVLKGICGCNIFLVIEFMFLYQK